MVRITGSEGRQPLGLAHPPAVLIIAPAKPVPVPVDAQADPAEAGRAAAAGHVLAGLAMLHHHAAAGTGPELRSQEHLHPAPVLAVVETKGLVPGRPGQEVPQELALLVAAVVPSLDLSLIHI